MSLLSFIGTEQHMGKFPAQTKADDSLWSCGLSMADFEVPSKPSAIAQAAHIYTSVTLDLAETMDSAEVGTLEVGNPDPLEVTIDLIEAAAGWDSIDLQEEDLADRKVLWPYLDPDSYKPSTSVPTRIEDNIAAVKLAKQLAQDQRTATPDEMTQLLRYSGWGGVSRVFAPDGSSPHALSALRDELKDITSPEAFAAMQASVNTSFYTPPEIVKAMWRVLTRLGFAGGRIIEPAAGTGHLIASMPQALARKSSITAVELDPTSAQILETNFAPYGLQVHACGLETAKVPVGFYDVCIANVPFGEFKTNDTSKAPYADWSIHNWFMAKAMELVRPGGLVVAITTRSTMDSKTETHRRWLAAHGELIGAFRMPTMTFAEHAKTEAVTDLLIFRRREMPDFSARPLWVGTAPAVHGLFAAGQTTSVNAYSRANGRSFTQQETVNDYFNHNPDGVLGRLAWASTQHGQAALPVFDGDMTDLAQRLEGLIDQLPEGIYTPARVAEMVAPAVSPMARYENLDGLLPGAFVERNGRICLCEGDELLDLDSLYTGTARKRMLGMMQIRDAATRVIEHQAKSQDDVELKRLQGHLNRSYDTFVATLGPISTTANSRIMRSDPSWPLMLALEIWDEENETAQKADIFTKRTVGVPEVPLEVDNVKDAILISLALYGRIDLADMARRYRKPVHEITDEMQAEGLAFRDPVMARWVPADEYLSGHIRDKIAQARAGGPAYAHNVPALEAVLPEDLGPADVEARLGAPWIPCDVIAQFSNELVNNTRAPLEVTFDQSTATWSLKSSSGRVDWLGDRALQVMKWGTDSRCALTLVEAALNQQPPTVTCKIDNQTVVDAAATFAAREKWQAIRDEFRMWVYRDEGRRDRLLRIYNDQFNQLVNRRWCGAHLHLPGMSKAVKPYPHQMNAIWRILVGGNTLLAHCVGAGKTLEMVAGSMELRRLGKARKPLHVVMGNCLEQYTAEFVRLYPQARVLMATKDDLNGEKRRTFVARIATGDWDAIVMTQSTFERIMLSPERQEGFIEAQLAEARTMMALTDDRGAKRSIKEIEKRMKEYEAKIKRLVDNGKADDQNAVWFDELGIDFVLYDESHAVKNLGRMSKMPRIAGLPNVASQRAFDFFMKTRLIMQDRGGVEEGVVMASATPISNSLAEAHTCQVYLQPYTLKKYGLYEFDAWSASFGEAVTGIELAPDGSGFRTNTRYSKFCNAAEMMAIFKRVADIQTRRMLNLPTPRLEGGKPQVMVAKPSAALKQIVAGLVDRADRIRNRGVRPEEDNMLAVTNDGRKAALDVRMVDPSLPADPQGKLALAAENIFRIWKDGAAQRHTQLVFSDLGTPGAKGFSVYEELRRLLMDKGIPRAEIEFMQDHDSDAAKGKLYKRVREGTVRVLIGSTSKMGTGTNVQKRLKGLHQLDIPWRPSDSEQRDGRADRQGNECESIELWRYVTEQSFDAYSLNLLDVKSRFIEQVMTAEKGLRTVEDISMTALSYAELKAIASGNPLVMEKATVDASVQKLGLAYSRWEDGRWRMANRKAVLRKRIGWISDSMPAVELDAKLAAAMPKEPNVTAMGRTAQQAVAGCSTAAAAIGQAFRQLTAAKQEGAFAEVGGFTLCVSRGYQQWDLVVCTPNSGLRATVDRPNINDVDGVGQATLDTIAGIADDPRALRGEHASKSEELASVDRLLNEDFEHREALARARGRQAEIETMLDLDKSTAGTAAMAETQTA